MEDRTFRYDIEGLVKEMEIDWDTTSTLYSEYFFEMKENIEKIRILIKEQDWYKLERVMHNIKGTSVSLSILDIYNAAANLDAQLKSNKIDDVPKCAEYLSQLFNTAEKDIREFFRKKGITI